MYATNQDDVINQLTEDDSYKLWLGKDYCNFIAKDFVDLDKPFDGLCHVMMYVFPVAPTHAHLLFQT